MMMENDPMENEFKVLLSDYAAPIPDDGFAQSVKTRIEKRARLRRFMIGGASLMGGIIAGAQIPKLITLIRPDAAAQSAEMTSLTKSLLPTIPELSLTEISAGLSQGPLWMTIALGVTALSLLWWMSQSALDAL